MSSNCVIVKTLNTEEHTSQTSLHSPLVNIGFVQCPCNCIDPLSYRFQYQVCLHTSLPPRSHSAWKPYRNTSGNCSILALYGYIYNVVLTQGNKLATHFALRKKKSFQPEQNCINYYNKALKGISSQCITVSPRTQHLI